MSKIVWLCLWIIPGWALGVESILDARGRRVPLNPKPQRVVSLALSSDVMLFDMMPSSERHRIAALSFFVDDATYSLIADDAARIKGRVGQDMEGLTALKPDLVICATYSSAAKIKALENAGIKTFVMGGFGSIEGIFTNLKYLSQLVHLPDAGAKISQASVRRLKAIESKTATFTKKATILNFSADGTLWGKNTSFNSAAEAAGLVNLARDHGVVGWKKVSLETIAALNPNFVVAVGLESNRSSVVSRIQGSLGWKHIKAVRDGKILLVPGPLMSSASHRIVDLVELMHEHAYGE